MTGFLLVAVVLVAIALAWVLPPLWRARQDDAAASGEASNLAILQEGMAELERDLKNGMLQAPQYQQAREDLERRALEEARVSASTASQPQAVQGRRAVAVLAIVIPLCTAGLYWKLGTPEGVTWSAASIGSGEVTAQQIETMVAQLAVRLKKNSEDGNGWALLARSYFVLQRYPEAASAYARAAELIKDDADLLADYADTVAMTQDRRIDAKVMQIVDAALRIDPRQWKALAMAGSGASERKDYAKAVDYWTRLQARAEPESELGRMLAANIAEAQKLGGIKPSARPAAPSNTAGMRGTVSLSPALAGKAAPTDAVFIFARAAAGPRMPLAVVRRQVKDLPFTFTLDDSQAMAPELKLSNFREVVVGARISKGGSATPQSGDLQGLSATVKAGARGVTVVIDQVVP